MGNWTQIYSISRSYSARGGNSAGHLRSSGGSAYTSEGAFVCPRCGDRSGFSTECMRCELPMVTSSPDDHVVSLRVRQAHRPGAPRLLAWRARRARRRDALAALQSAGAPTSIADLGSQVARARGTVTALTTPANEGIAARSRSSLTAEPCECWIGCTASHRSFIRTTRAGKLAIVDPTGMAVIDPSLHDLELHSASGGRELVLREGDLVEVVGAVVGTSAVPKGLPTTYRERGRAPLLGPVTLWLE